MTVARQQIDETLTLLCARFPRAFFRLESQRRPLAIGIGPTVEKILGDAVRRPVLNRTLQFYVGNAAYLRSLKTDAIRVDIDGNEAGRVTEEQASFALEKLAARKTKQHQQKKKTVVTAPKPAPPTTVVTSASPPPTPVVKPPPARDGLAALREAAARRRSTAA